MSKTLAKVAAVQKQIDDIYYKLSDLLHSDTLDQDYEKFAADTMLHQTKCVSSALHVLGRLIENSPVDLS